MKEPVRLLTGGSPDVQDVLRSAAGDEPLRFHLDQLAARLAPAVAAPAGGGLLAWALAGTAVLGGTAALVLTRDHPEPPAATARATQTPPAGRPDPVVAAPAPTTPEDAPASAKAEAPAKIARPVVATEPAHPIPPPFVPSELELLTPANAALHANDLVRALALAERHASLHPQGMFAEEREAIAIEALYRLGQHDRARTRFTAFTTHYPHSSYRARLERTVRE
jgi:hypothetical protein